MCSWDPVAGATGGYTAKYEQTLDLRGTIRTIARDKLENSTKFSIGASRYLTQARFKVAAIGPDQTGPYTNWAEVNRPPPAPVWVSVSCRDDADLSVLWTKVAGATQYRLTIGISGRSTTAQTVTEYVPVATQADPPTNHTYTGTIGARYTITVAATRDGTTWSGESPSDSATCTPVAPPAPTAVTAACSNRVLTVTWNSPGTGLSKATSHKPRIFTGESTTPDTRWTANAAGHDTTTATIPAPGEPDLPETGVFQVKVKATNTAGDSDWSDPVKATCGPPGPIEDLKCTAITKDQITIEWNTAVGAQNYTLIIAPTPTGTSQPSLSIAALQQEKQSHTFEGLYSSHLHRIAVQPTNTKLGPTATLECTTLDNDWLEVECSNSAVLTADWDDPSGSGPAPSGYSAIVYFDDPERGRGAVHTHVGTGTSTLKALVQGRQYVVSLVSQNGNGGPVYSQTVTHTCPGPQRPAWDSPNDRDTWVWRLFDAAVVAVVGTLTRNIDAGFWAAEQGGGLLTGKKNPSLARTSRSCRKPTAAELADDSDLDRVCEETWSESVNVRMKPLASWQQLYIVRAYNRATGETIVFDGISYTVPVIAAAAAAWLAGGSALVASVKVVATLVAVWALAETGVIIYREQSGQDWARLFPEQAAVHTNGDKYCMPSTDTHNNKKWKRHQESVTSTDLVAGYKTETVASISFCKEA